MAIRFALAPLQWLATADGWLDRNAALPLPRLAAEVARLGFQAIKAEPPNDLPIEEYRRELAKAGLAPAPGYLSGPLEQVDARPQLVARAGQLAEKMSALGLTELFIAAGMDREAVRVRRPAMGIDADVARLGDIAATLMQLAAETRKHGVTLCLHQHVGTWIESEEEIEWLLERLDPELVALGPDVGHLAWAGVDVTALARRHAGRIRAVHLKDVRLDVAERYRSRGASYRETVLAGLWAEPGSGDLDLRGFLDALPGYQGWAIVEVDRPSLSSPEESVAACARWVNEVGEAMAPVSR